MLKVSYDQYLKELSTLPTTIIEFLNGMVWHRETINHNDDSSTSHLFNGNFAHNDKATSAKLIE